MKAPLPGEVVWYVTGRFYAAPDGSIFDVGYFFHLPCVGDDLFSGAPGEATAHFTFSSEPFQVSRLQNGDLQLGLDTTGDFSIFLNRRPAGDFANPASFARGEAIARFRRRHVVLGTTVQATPGGSPVVMGNVFSAALLESRELEWQGRRIDLGQLLPQGVTQWGTASGNSLPPPTGYTAMEAFAASAIAVG